MKPFANRTHSFETSIFAKMSQKAKELNAVNLSQGFPDFEGPSFLLNAAKEAIDSENNQYAPYPGIIELRQSIHSYYQRFYNLNYDANEEVTVTVGATEAIFASIMALVNPGDEVIVFEPFYDSYISSIEMAQAKAVAITLHAPDFNFIVDELNNAVTDKTKLIILNNPHNPSGKVFTKSELEQIANIAIKNDLYVISDEVYEFLTYETKHIPMASIENMQHRTITISSAGKTFSVTGWKIGWCCTSKEISKIIRNVHQYITFSVATPLQFAVSVGLDNLENYLVEFRKSYNEKRQFFYQVFKELGYDFKIPQGTYFMMVPISQKTQLNDIEYCYELMEKKKVASIPPSVFYLNSNDGKKYLRFCYAKKDETLKLAADNLKLL